MGGDHREAVAEGDDDRRRDAGQGRREDEVLRDGDRSAPVGAVEPVDAEQVPGVGRIRVDSREPGPGRGGDRRGSISSANVGRIVRVSRKRRTVRS